MTDAAGVAGAGYDQLVADDLVVASTSDEPFALSLYSAHDGADGPVDNWDPLESRRWHVATVSGDLSGFDVAKLHVDTMQFAVHNDLGGGHVRRRAGHGRRAADHRRGVQAHRRLHRGPGGRRRRRQLHQGHRADGGVGDGRLAARGVGLQGRCRRPGLGHQHPARHRPGDERDRVQLRLDHRRGAVHRVARDRAAVVRRERLGGAAPRRRQPGLRHSRGELHHHGHRRRPRRDHSRHRLRDHIRRRDIYDHPGHRLPRRRRRGRRRVPGRRHVLRVRGRARRPHHQRHIRHRHVQDHAQRGRWSVRRTERSPRAPSRPWTTARRPRSRSTRTTATTSRRSRSTTWP